MKQLFVDGKGTIHILDVPIPGKFPRGVLVRTDRSLISSGTEGSAVTTRRGIFGLYEKAVQSRDRVGQVWNLVRRQGLTAAHDLIASRLHELTPLGYSAAGTVVEVDDAVAGISPGDRVACMGAGFACHAEFGVVPQQLLVKMPAGVDFDEAAFGAIACIAMQGLRRLELSPGESVAVVGLGLIGQLVVQIGNALGYRMLGLDVNESKAVFAKDCGALDAWAIATSDSVARVFDWTSGHGADGVVICAATTSDDPLNLGFDLCRPLGHVSVVGDVGLRADRARMYRKELDMRIARSYGPGRYDPEYELEGRDYPIAYARWTSRRNLELYLDLLARKRLRIDRLVSGTFSLDDAADAYSKVKTGTEVYGMLFEYPRTDARHSPQLSSAKIVEYGRVPSLAKKDTIRLGLIGCGSFTKAVHLPNLARLGGSIAIEGVASRSGGTAADVAGRTHARFATSDYRALLDKASIDAVLVTTRHSSHGKIVADALSAGKHVFVEKPMAITLEECDRIVHLASTTGLTVRVGFNRRFAPLYRAARSLFEARGSRTLLYRVNVGPIGDHWSNHPNEGGRFLGEATHFLDFFNWFCDSVPLSFFAAVAGEPVSVNPNVTFVATYPDSTTATLLYCVSGSARMDKECLEIYAGGRSLRCRDFNRLEIFGGREVRDGRLDKGHRGVLADFIAAIRQEATNSGGADARAGRYATRLALDAYASARQALAGCVDAQPMSNP